MEVYALYLYRSQLTSGQSSRKYSVQWLLIALWGRRQCHCYCSKRRKLIYAWKTFRLERFKQKTEWVWWNRLCPVFGKSSGLNQKHKQRKIWAGAAIDQYNLGQCRNQTIEATAVSWIALFWKLTFQSHFRKCTNRNLYAIWGRQLCREERFYF